MNRIKTKKKKKLILQSTIQEIPNVLVMKKVHTVMLWQIEHSPKSKSHAEFFIRYGV